MQSCLVPIIAAATTAALLQHSLLADTVVLSNGDQLNGQVIEQADGRVVLNHPQLGQVIIANNKVASIRIGDASETSADPDDSLTDPTAPPSATEPEPGPPGQDKPSSHNAVASEAAEAAAKQEARSAFDAYLKEWDTKLTIGFTGTSGNTDRQNYHARFDTLYKTDDTKWAINIGWFYATADDNSTQNELQSQITRDWLQKDRPWFLFIRGEHEYDQFRRWENRASGFGGAGYTFIDNETIDLKGRVGLGGTYEFGEINEFTPEAMFGGSAVQWKINDRQTLSGEFTYFPSLEEESDFRMQSKIEWKYKLDMADGLALKVGIQNEYDSRTPGEDDNNDMKYYGALVIDF